MVNLANNSYRSNANNRIIYQNSGMRNTSYRNELYDRTSGYDVPRQLMRNNGGYNPSIVPNRPRYAAASRGHRQRSFDDTESYHYANNSNHRCENIYEQIHDEPVYRNVNINGAGSAARHYGRLDVIGHGIGRIERHLSSSCGNIDHYNLGGHYAVLGHSHLGTVGHIRLNAATAPNSTRESGGKSLNLFSCLGRENSQSMNNIYRASAASTNNEGAVSRPSHSAVEANVGRQTGAIPKAKNKVAPKSCSPPPMHTTAFNRIPKSSLQWLLVNNWLPLWVGDGPDYNVLDFNFMFSRNCNGCGSETMSRQQTLPHPNNSRSADIPLDYDYRTDNSTYNALRILRANQSLPRSRDGERCFFRRDGSADDRVRCPRTTPSERFRAFPNAVAEGDHAREIFERNLRRRYEMPQHLHANRMQSHPPSLASDPFRHWELNSENNSFRPAQAVRRITDGTLPHHNNTRSNQIAGPHSSAAAAIRIEVTESFGFVQQQHPQLLQQQASTSQQANRSGQSEAVAAASSSIQLHNEEAGARAVELSPNNSRMDDADNEKSSPESSNQRRFFEHAEDDQSAANRISDNNTSSYGDYTSGLNNAHSDEANTDDDDQSSFGPSDDGKDLTDK